MLTQFTRCLFSQSRRDFPSRKISPAIHCWVGSRKISPAFQRRGVGVAWLLFAFLSMATLPAHAQAVQIALGDQGLRSLQYGGVELLRRDPGVYDGQTFRVTKVVLRKPDGTETTLDGGGPSQVRADPAHGTVTRTFAWGTARCAFAVRNSRLSLSIAVADTTPDTTVQAIYLQPLVLQFPQMPQGYGDGYPRLAANLGTPTVLGADYGAGVLALCNDDVKRPLIIGFPYSLDKPANTRYPIVINAGPTDWLGGRLNPVNVHTLAPGHSESFQISLRFGPPGTSPEALAADLDAKMAAAFPFKLHWPDRRPLGYLMLSSTVPHRASGKNPRGWFNNDANIDVTTDTGRADFRKRLMDYADNSIRVLKAMNAQGAITWDIEGQEFPHATSYIGDPRLVPDLAPEMQPLADAYFKKLRDAGLRVGVCVRPQHFTRATGQQDLTDPDQIVQILLDKITYANTRWGCTLFYVDSNGDPNVPYDPAIFERVTEALTKKGVHALLMPEQKTARYYAVTAPYAELRGGHVSTPDAVRRVYPGVFTVLNVADGPMDADHDALLAAVRHGDILLFRAWWDDTYNAKVKSIYQEAGKSR